MTETMTKTSELLASELRGNLPLQYVDGPEYCTVTDATGGAFALTVQPELMKLMEQAALRPTPANSDMAKLADELVAWVERYAMKVCPEGCLPTPGQEREISMFAGIVRALRQSPSPAEQDTPSKEDFAKWSRVWHDTCETIVTLLGLPGSGSPQEMLAQVQAYATAAAAEQDGREAIAPVKRIEMVDFADGFEKPAAPMWRVTVGIYCADFEHETAANNFRNAILSLLRLPSSGNGVGMREALEHPVATALARRLCQLFDSGGESQRSVRARHASALFQLLNRDGPQFLTEQAKCDADPVGYLQAAEIAALAAVEPARGVETRCARCGSSGDVFMMCAGCQSPLSAPVTAGVGEADVPRLPKKIGE